MRSLIAHLSLIFSHFSRRGGRQGMTLIELLVFLGIFSIVAVFLVGMLVTVYRVELRQNAAIEVGTQSQSLLQMIERVVEDSSYVDIPAGTPTSTLVVARYGDSVMPGALMRIYVSEGRVYRDEIWKGGSIPPEPLTSPRVAVSGLTFTKRANDGARDAVAVNFTMTYNSQNLQEQFSQVLDTTIARVSAATFDSDIRASSTNTYRLGTSAQEWQSINNTLFFGTGGGGANAGFGGSPTADAGVKLQVSNGDLYLSTSGDGIIFKAGTFCYLFRMTAAGAFVTSSVSCP